MKSNEDGLKWSVMLFIKEEAIIYLFTNIYIINTNNPYQLNIYPIFHSAFKKQSVCKKKRK